MHTITLTQFVDVWLWETRFATLFHADMWRLLFEGYGFVQLIKKYNHI
jgi:hypothetical protein